MQIPVNPVATDFAQQPVTIRFSDGRIQDAILQSNLLQRDTVQFVPLIPADDRRKHARAPYFNDVRIDQLGVRRTMDISNGGLYVECLTHYPPRTTIPIAIDIGNETFCIDARVAFIDPGIGMGLEFYRIPQSVQLKLESLVHKIIKEAGRDRMKSRRQKKERRNPDSPTKHMRIRRDTLDRRNIARPSTAPVPVDLSCIKTIFFHGDLKISYPRGPEVLIELHDGEELQVRLLEISPDPHGLFAEYTVSDDLSYAMYIVKSAIKNIQCLV